MPSVRALLRWSICCGLAVITASGCAAFPRGGPPPGNPLYVRANDGDFVWERTVDVLHNYLFDIEREDKLGGIIETRYKVGSNWFEPWHPDSVGPANLSESTLQSIRRKTIVSITPVDGGYLVSIEALKELEDVINANPRAGRATFLDNLPLQRELQVITGPAAPAGWIPKGRDPALEDALLRSLTDALQR